MSTILEMRSITKEFPGVIALADVSLTVERGTVHAICGENGAGKSTLMKVLSGVYPAGDYRGEIEFDGQIVQFKDIRDSEAAGIVIIHQELALSPYLSIAENIFLGNEITHRGLIDWDATNREAAKLLARVGLGDSPDVPVNEIGVGKQQLVEIAKALSKDVKLLILDEPTAALNDDDSAHLLDLIRHLRGQGITCIIISHKLNEIRAIADEVTIIRDGRTIETLDVATGGTSEDRIIRGMVGRELENRYPDRDAEIGDEVLRVEDWTVHHPTDANRVVIHSANITVRAGEVVGIAGLMGAGRTELAMSVFGRSFGSRITGSVYVRGQKVDTSTVPKAIRAGLAYVTEDRKGAGLNLIDTIKRNISLAGMRKLTRRGWVDGQEEYLVANRYRQSMNIKAPTVDVGGGQALRRQPAEGRAVAVAVLGSRGAHPRRAHPRHRRGGQVRDLHDHQHARRAGQGGARHLVRAARAARHLRPHLHTQRGPHHRPAAHRGGHTRGPHGAHDEGEGSRPCQCLTTPSSGRV